MGSFAHCPGDALCDSCRADSFAFLRGTAACRGSCWAARVARQTNARPPWPSYAGRCRSIAIRKVADLTSDEQLREQLAQIVCEWAARSWPSKRLPIEL